MAQSNTRPLSKFDGHPVTSQRLIFTGSHLVAGDLHAEHAIGDRMIVLSEVEVVGVGYKPSTGPGGKDTGAYRRIETTSVRRYAVLDAGTGNTLSEKHLPKKAGPDDQEKLDLDNEE